MYLLFIDIIDIELSVTFIVASFVFPRNENSLSPTNRWRLTDGEIEFEIWKWGVYIQHLWDVQQKGDVIIICRMYYILRQQQNKRYIFESMGLLFVFFPFGKDTSVQHCRWIWGTCISENTTHWRDKIHVHSKSHRTPWRWMTHTQKQWRQRQKWAV